MVLAPTAFTRALYPGGEIPVARAAEYRVPYAVSTFGTTSLQDVALAAPGGNHWFQLYTSRSREIDARLLGNARDAGFKVLVVTIDVPVLGSRGVAFPPPMAESGVWNPYADGWNEHSNSAPIELAVLSERGATIDELLDRHTVAANVSDIERLREQWKGPLVVKGILSARDARRAVNAGADGIVVSSHGGRQLDHAAAPLRVLPSIVRELAKMDSEAKVFLDGGIRSGEDIAIAIAAGADAVLIGQLYLKALMAGGQQGVVRALEILTAEFVTAMHILGVATPRALDSTCVNLPGIDTGAYRV